MCGRFALSKSDRIDWAQFGVRRGPTLPPHWNLGPGRPIAAVRAASEGTEALMLRWGLVPFWAKDATIGNRLANARVETAAEKPAFRDAFKARRCLVPADGFYEWQTVAGSARKQPWFVRRRDDGVFALAGVWERWRPPAPDGTEAPLETCALFTMDPNALMAPIHARMPLIIAPDAYAEWLSPATPASRVRALVSPWEPDEWVAYRVGLRVNAVSNNDEGCVAALVDP